MRRSVFLIQMIWLRRENGRGSKVRSTPGVGKDDAVLSAASPVKSGTPIPYLKDRYSTNLNPLNLI